MFRQCRRINNSFTDCLLEDNINARFPSHLQSYGGVNNEPLRAANPQIRVEKSNFHHCKCSVDFTPLIPSRLNIEHRLIHCQRDVPLNHIVHVECTLEILCLLSPSILQKSDLKIIRVKMTSSN